MGQQAATALQTLRNARVSAMGTGGLLFEAPGSLALTTQRRIWAMAEALQATAGIAGAHPGMNNLLVRFDVLHTSGDEIRDRVMDAWSSTTASERQGRLLEVGVVYGGEAGADLPELCQRTGLAATDIAQLHSAPEYTVFAPGNKGGFGYLFGLDERLFFPRKDSPVTRRGGGLVSIGGQQCNLGSPGAPDVARITGWNAIARAGDLPEPFDLARDPPVLLQMGDRVRFQIVEVLA